MENYCNTTLNHTLEWHEHRSEWIALSFSVDSLPLSAATHPYIWGPALPDPHVPWLPFRVHFCLLLRRNSCIVIGTALYD